MGRNVSIVITGKDSFSSTISSIRNSSKAFSKDMDSLQKKLDIFNDTRATLRLDTSSARNELSSLKKRYEETGSAADLTAYKLANQRYEQARRNLDLVGKSAKQTEKEMLNLGNTQSKLSNRASQSVTMLKGIAAAGIGSMAGDALMQAGNAFAGSALGDSSGAMLGSTFGGAASGAGIGTMLAPGIGTAVGAVVGAGIGAVNGAVQTFKKEDDAFKAYYTGQYSRVTEENKTLLAGGSGIAAGREMDEIAFSKLLGGDKIAADYLLKTREMANSTPFVYSDLTAMSKTLAPAFGDSPQRMLELMNGIGDAGASVGLDKSNMEMVATAMGRMQSTGKTTLEYLNLLQERGIDAYQFVADGLGTTKGGALEAISKSEVGGVDAVNWILKGMQDTFGGAMELQSKTFSGLSSTLQGFDEEIQAAMGQGYNTLRKDGLEKQIGFYEGESGKAMMDAYSAIGRHEARKENLAEEYQRDTFSAVMGGDISPLLEKSGLSDKLTELKDAFLTAQISDDGAAMDSLISEARIIAENAYNADAGTQTELQRGISLLEQIRDNTAAQGGWDAEYRLSQEGTNGMAAPKSKPFYEVIPEILSNSGGKNSGITSSWQSKLDGDFTGKYFSGKGGSFPARAMGVSYIPRDNTPIMAHQGERLQTASEARASDANGVSVVITGNEFIVRDDTDIEKIARALADKLKVQQMARGGG